MIKLLKSIQHFLGSKSRNFKIKGILYSFLFIIFIVYWFSLPKKVFKTPLSTVIYSSDGHLLSARVASDGQWRFPTSDSIPHRFKTCLIAFEDRYFYYHLGINPISIFRAIKQNTKNKKVVSGGSTLTMQVARLSMDHRKRNFLNKTSELLRATRLELTYSKDEILALWAANAPFGGNVIGLEAAAWRYFNRSPHQLSWAECATLAVLPNAPSLIYIGKNQNLLIKKRNRLLGKLLKEELIDKITHDLAINEDLPSTIYTIPDLAPHLADQFNTGIIEDIYSTTIDYNLQNEIARIAQPLIEANATAGIGNAAILVLDVNSGEVLAYHGNLTAQRLKNESSHFVDIIKSPRSSGSTLKPMLYAMAFDRGTLLPSSLMADIPVQIGDYQPQNFDKDFTGLTPASQALASSLNIPAVKLLQKIGVVHFYNLLNTMGFSTINRGPDDYGLSLILGGAETTLWELTGVYASMARVLNKYQSKGYNASDWHEPILFSDKIEQNKKPKDHIIISASALALTMNSLLDANRPINETGWRLFANNEKIAWKTGTSFGFRDAWSIGVSSKYAIGVWVGNANGEGRPGLTGLSVAAPLMFKIFAHLPDNIWFNMPKDEMAKIEICSHSGFKAGPNCPDKKMVWADINGELSPICPYHKMLNLDLSEQFQVNSSCFDLSTIIQKSWFVMPPLIEYYYKLRNPEYKSPPPFHPDCLESNQLTIEFIYPENGTKIFITNDFSGQPSPIIFKATHRNAKSLLYWHLDNQYLGKTLQVHEMPVLPKPGKHLITLMDEEGNVQTCRFEILAK